MTTVIGIAGKDPETSESYVVIAADTRGTLHGRLPLDIKKVFAGEDSNYAFGIAGRSISNNFSPNFESEIYDFINNSKTEDKKYIETTLKSIDDALEKQYGDNNSYLVSIKKDDPELLALSKKGLVNVGAYKSIGSGSDFAYSVLDVLDKYVEDDRVNLSKIDALKVVFESLNEAASKDKFTGGHMDVAIVTQSNVKFLPSYKDIIKSSKEFAPLLGDKDAPQTMGIHPYHNDD
jgi:20S proteasome alpha/beta subunit